MVIGLSAGRPSPARFGILSDRVTSATIFCYKRDSNPQKEAEDQGLCGA
jgi:hypothetical protein